MQTELDLCTCCHGHKGGFIKCPLVIVTSGLSNQEHSCGAGDLNNYTQKSCAAQTACINGEQDDTQIHTHTKQCANMDDFDI